ncbi:MAG: oligosaccharide flippase family protein [Capsulimonadaceae bacterium]|nr:oligosaccharide flippase family protein [Capsulimonadaceae bacterium]
MSMQQATADPPEPSSTNYKQTVVANALGGAKALTLRTAFSIVLRIVSSLCLARLLFPRDYGAFAIAAYVTSIGMYLCDAGLASALVRQPGKPSANEMVTVFVCQQILTGVAVFGIICATPLLVHYSHFPGRSLLMVDCMALGLFLSSLRNVPMMSLERNLSFVQIAWCELLEGVVQTASAILFAYLGWGPWALAGSGLCRGLVGLCCVWRIAPWRPSGKFELSIVRRLLRFGLPFQLTAIIPGVLSGWSTILVSKLVSVAAVGIVGWATNIASVPMMLSGVLNRIAFPAYSRIQDEPAVLTQYVISSIRRINAVVVVVASLVVFTVPVLIPLIFRSRWAAAIPLVQWLSMDGVLTITNGLVASAQCALGYPGDRLGITILLGSLRWAVGYAVIATFGISGVGPMMVAMTCFETFVALVILRRREPACAPLLPELASAVASEGFAICLALALSWIIFPASILGRAICGVLLYGIILAVREQRHHGGRLLPEYRALFIMMSGARKNTTK